MGGPPKNCNLISFKFFSLVSGIVNCCNYSTVPPPQQLANISCCSTIRLDTLRGHIFIRKKKKKWAPKNSRYYTERNQHFYSTRRLKTLDSHFFFATLQLYTGWKLFNVAIITFSPFTTLCGHNGAGCYMIFSSTDLLQLFKHTTLPP